MAGLGESCTHVGAVLFYLEANWRYLSNKTVTQEKAYWPVPAAIDKIPYAEIREIDFMSAATKKRKIDSEINGEQVELRGRMKMPDVPKPTEKEKADMLNDIHKAGASAVILSVSTTYQKPFIPKILRDGQLPDPLLKLRDEKYVGMEGDELREECKRLFDSITVTPEQAKNVEILTRQQSKSKDWHRLRMGRITASNMKAVCSTTIERPAISTVKSICGLSSFKSQATAYGCKHEKVALQAYVNTKRSEHENFSVTESGLWLDPNYPFLGASPDGLVSCNCCGEGLVEIKCPYCARDSPMADVECLKENKLDPSHRYSYQVQTQMLVTGRDYCDFVLWSEKEMMVERIEPNERMENEIISKSKAFFLHVILPEMTGSLISRLSSIQKSNPVQKQKKTHLHKTKLEFKDKHKKKTSDILCQAKINQEEKHNSNEGYQQTLDLCICKERCDEKSGRVVKCDGENCHYGLLHFDCVNVKRKPKPPYYCPDCRKSLWR